jgi:hypothetical protein
MVTMLPRWGKAVVKQRQIQHIKGTVNETMVLMYSYKNNIHTRATSMPSAQPKLQQHYDMCAVAHGTLFIYATEHLL